MENNLATIQSPVPTPASCLKESSLRVLETVMRGECSPWNIQQAANRLRNECPSLVAERERINRELHPSHPDDIKTLLGRLALHCPSRDLAPKEAMLLIEDYLIELQPYPITAIEQACRKYRSNAVNVFFPSLAILLALVKQEVAPLHSRLHAIAKVLSAQPEAEPPAGQLSPAVEEQLRALKSGATTPRFTDAQRIENTVAYMREQGLPQQDIDAFMRSHRVTA